MSVSEATRFSAVTSQLAARLDLDYVFGVIAEKLCELLTCDSGNRLRQRNPKNAPLFLHALTLRDQSNMTPSACSDGDFAHVLPKNVERQSLPAHRAKSSRSMAGSSSGMCQTWSRSVACRTVASRVRQAAGRSAGIVRPRRSGSGRSIRWKMRAAEYRGRKNPVKACSALREREP